MEIKNNIEVYNISWLNHVENSGKIDNLYIPENRKELLEICRELFTNNIKFELIGHTSNIYFLPEFSCKYMVSTRNVKNISWKEGYVEVDTGVSVRHISNEMINRGFAGFEGLIDLPGTVGAAVYGNAGCYNCSIVDMMISCECLMSDGTVKTLYKDDLGVKTRSTALKRKEFNAVILSVKLNLIKVNVDELKALSDKYRKHRKQTQPGPNDNLGSIFSCPIERPTIIGYFVIAVAKLYTFLVSSFSNDKINKNEIQKKCILKILRANNLNQYLFGNNWNRFIWKDSLAHNMFWKFVKLHKFMFKDNNFEIEIKGDFNKYIK